MADALAAELALNPGHLVVDLAGLNVPSQTRPILRNHDQGRIVGHSDVAPGRKEDPGEKFDWEGLARNGVGLWPIGVPDLAMRVGVITGEVAVTLGAEGAVLRRAGREVARAAPPPTTVVDGTAAGDSFTAALTVALLAGCSDEDALRVACAAGALTVSRQDT